jgi:hypothetical protein
LENKVRLRGIQETFMVACISPTWRTSLHVREHGNKTSSPRASVVSTLFTFLVIAIELEVLIYFYHLCYIYLVSIFLSLSCFCYA